MQGERAGHASVAPLVRWARANGYSMALFSSEFAATSAVSWDAVLRGSPARFVALLVAGAAMPALQRALQPHHPLLYSRVKLAVVSCGDDWANGFSRSEMSDGAKEAFDHMNNVTLVLPETWTHLNAFAMHNCLFQLIEERIEKWQGGEMQKYAGFQDMKENDMPGLKRLTVDERCARMNRDRGDDELARLLRNNEKASSPGVLKEDEPDLD